MSLKLFKVKVDVESWIYVLAIDRKDAEATAADLILLEADELLLDALCYSSDINKINQIESPWGDSEPYISKKNEKDPDYKHLSVLTCKEIAREYEEEAERIRIKNELDKPQLKFEFMGGK